MRRLLYFLAVAAVLVACNQKPHTPTIYEKLGIDTTSTLYLKHKSFIDEQVHSYQTNSAKKDKHMKEYMGYDKMDVYGGMLEDDTLYLSCISKLMAEHICSPENDTLLIQLTRLLHKQKYLWNECERGVGAAVRSGKTTLEWYEQYENDSIRLSNEISELYKTIRQ